MAPKSRGQSRDGEDGKYAERVSGEQPFKAVEIWRGKDRKKGAWICMGRP